MSHISPQGPTPNPDPPAPYIYNNPPPSPESYIYHLLCIFSIRAIFTSFPKTFHNDETSRLTEKYLILIITNSLIDCDMIQLQEIQRVPTQNISVGLQK